MIPGQDERAPEALQASEVRLNRLEMAARLLSDIHVQIRTADEKLRALFGATALLAVALTFNAQQRLTTLRGGAFTALVLLDLCLFALFLLAVAVAVIAGMLALIPRVDLGTPRRSLFFFGHIAAEPHDQFVREFATLSEHEAIQQVLSQVHVNSLIVREKFKWTRYAANAFIAAVLLLILNQLVVFLM
jgi:hypothetical protein